MKTANMNRPEKQNRPWRPVCPGWGLVLTAMLLGPMAPAQVLPPGSAHYGKTYGQWSEAWWQWAFSLPMGHHPLFETADASAGQSGPVWFLGGNFTGTPVNRSILVPAGTALFFPILNSEQDNTDCNGNGRISDGLSEAALRENIKNLIDAGHDLSCTLDGGAVAGLGSATNAYRVASPTPGGFSYTLPGIDNLPSNWGYTCWGDPSGAPVTVEASVYHPVADGVYLLLPPLSVGSHTIHIGATAGTSLQDVTYHITVVDTNTGYANVLPTNAPAYGKTYSQWAGGWWQWLYSQESIHNPINDTADLSAGQSGPVWFLGGVFGGTTNAIIRTGVIPEGKALFFPVFNTSADNTSCDVSNRPALTSYTPAELLSFIQAGVDQGHQMSCTIDGVPVAGVSEATNTAYRVQSVFDYNYIPPNNNLLALLEGEPCYSDTSSAPTPFVVPGAVTDGIYLMLTPLPAGPHTIHIYAVNGNPGALPQNIIYQVTVVDSNRGNPGIAAPESAPHGKTYSQWTAEHWKWLYSMPVNKHPLFDTASVSEGQSGDVWFLGGTFTTTSSNGVVVGSALRNVTLPEGKALFFPLIDVESATAEGNGTNIAQLSAASQFFVDHANSLSCVIDGQPAQNLNQYRTQSPLFTWGPLPANNTFGDPANFPAGLTSQSVSDGYWLMLNPLVPGSHTIHFTGGLTLSTAKGDPFDFDFRLDITYNLTVVPTNGVFGTNAIVSGKSYGEWTEAWWQWVLSIPAAQNPNEDTNGQFAAVGQSGPVWFLGGSFGDLGASLSRTFAIPEGKNLFMPVYNWIFGSGAGDCDPSNPGVTCDIPTLRAAAATAATSVQQMDVTIDGLPVPSLRDHRAISPGGFSFILPDANVLQHLGLSADVAGTYTPQVSDGYWLLLAPLSVGNHTIVAHNIPDPSNGTEQQITYHITVRPVSLSLVRQGTNIILSWPQTSSSYVLQTASGVTPGHWSESGASVSALEGRYEVTLPIGNSSQFFRLRKQ